VRNFQILIVSVVKVCKQRLQTASASGNFVLAAGPRWGLPSEPADPFGSKCKFLALLLISHWVYYNKPNVKSDVDDAILKRYNLCKCYCHLHADNVTVRRAEARHTHTHTHTKCCVTVDYA